MDLAGDFALENAWQCVAFLVLPSVGYFFSDILVMPLGIDSWFYYAYATDFSRLLHRFGWTYYGARLSWNGFQSLYYHAFPPLVAHFLIGLTISFAGSWSLYWITLRYFGRPAAIITGLALAANPLFITASFWSYPNGAVISASLVSIAAFIKGHDERKDGYLLAAGAVIAVATLAHNITLLLVPPAILLILIDHRKPVPSVLKHLALMAGSSVTTVFLFCVGTQVFFGKFLFFGSIVTETVWVVSGGWHEWVKPISTWIFGATALVLPITVFLLSAGVRALRKPEVSFESGNWIFLYNVYAVLLYGIFDFVFHAGRLQHVYYFVFIFVPVFLLLGAFMGHFLDDFKGRQDVYLLCASIVLFQLILMRLAKAIYLVPERTAWIALLATLAAMLCPVLLVRKPGVLWKTLLANALMALLFVAGAADHRLPLMNASDKRDYLLTIAVAQRFLRVAVRPERKILFWYDASAQGSALYTGINALYLYGYARFNGVMPLLTADDVSKVDATTSIVLLFSSTSQGDDAVRALAAYCLTPKVSETGSFGRDEDRRADPYSNVLVRRVRVWVVDVRRAVSPCGATPSSREDRGWRWASQGSRGRTMNIP